MSEKEDEEYTACYNCGEVVPKNYKFCPHCGIRIFHLHMTPLLLVSAGIYFLNAILLAVIFFPHLLFVITLEFGTAFLLIFGSKFAAGLGLMLSVLNTIFLVYLLTRPQISISLAILLVVTHVVGAYLIVHEWENLA